MDAMNPAEKDANLVHLEKADSLSSGRGDVESAADTRQDWTAQEEKKLKCVYLGITPNRSAC